MNMMVKFACLFAALLSIAGVAFANGTCYNYVFNWINLDNGNTGPGCTELCFNYENQTGSYSYFFGSPGSLSLFFESSFLNKLAIAYDLVNDVGYLKFHGSPWQNVFTGIFSSGIERFTVWGHRSESCPVFSDETWKKNIEPLSSSLEKVMLLQGVSYDWKVDEYPEKGFTKNRQIGFIAQDVEKVFPELVQTDNNGYKAVYYSQMVPVLLEAMKEQQKEISELKKQQAMFTALTDKIAQLEKALEQKGSSIASSVK